jgi:hypothetical protein
MIMDPQQLLQSGEGRAILTARANALLITGAAEIGDELVRVLSSHVAAPVHTLLGWPREGPPQQGTVIMREVDRLSPEEQHAMLCWLSQTNTSVQMISVCAEPLFPLVTRGQFLVDLYYHLNIIYVQLEVAAP